MPSDLILRGGDWQAVLVPGTGGAMARLDWRGLAVFRPARGTGILDMASFPLVPFSNRIAGSRFTWNGREVVLAPNHPLGGDEPVLHGFGWVSGWKVEAAGADFAALTLEHRPGAWPWAFRARQTLRLGAAAVLTLAIENCSDEAMPAGLGFHPYFLRDAATRLSAAHRGEWQVDARTLPTHLVENAEPQDWWAGSPVGTRHVDTAYTGRSGPLVVSWPERGLEVTLEPDADLSTTVIYVPAGADFFCAEPVSHATDALNRGGMRTVQPGESWTVSLTLTARQAA